jgi:hypothetical protein
MRGFNCDGLYAVVTPTDALPVTMVTSNTPTMARTSGAQKAEKKIALHHQSYFKDCPL